MGVYDKKEIKCDCDVINKDVVDTVSKKLLKEEKINRLSTFFKVFSDSTRLKIICALDENEMCVCDLSYLLNMTKSAVSHQLAYLKNHNLVNYRREGKMVIYSLSDYHIKMIYNYGKEHLEE